MCMSIQKKIICVLGTKKKINNLSDNRFSGLNSNFSFSEKKKN